MHQFLLFVVLVASLKCTLCSPAPPDRRPRGQSPIDSFQTEDYLAFEEDAEKCFIHVKIQSCQNVLDITLQIEGSGQDPMKVDVSKGSQQDVCLSVPCQGGRLTKPLKLTATAPADEDLTIGVTPEQLDVNFKGLKKDSTKCYGDPSTPADISVTCPGETGKEAEDEDEFLESFEMNDDDDDEAQSQDLQLQNLHTGDGFNNHWDQPLSYVCPSGQAIRYVFSIHNNHREDRKWRLHCRTVSNAPFELCQWSGYVNWWDRPFAYTCPKNFVIAGMASHHNNRREDRRWAYLCCRARRTVTQSCYQTGYLNKWDKPLHFETRGNQVIIGVKSYHCNKREDRRYGFTVCHLVNQ